MHNVIAAAILSSARMRGSAPADRRASHLPDPPRACAGVGAHTRPVPSVRLSPDDSERHASRRLQTPKSAAGKMRFLALPLTNHGGLAFFSADRRFPWLSRHGGEDCLSPLCPKLAGACWEFKLSPRRRRLPVPALPQTGGCLLGVQALACLARRLGNRRQTEDWTPNVSSSRGNRRLDGQPTA
jgi:hypothetical protein